MPKRITLALSQGNDETLAGTVTEADFGTPLDLTGVTLEMLLKDTPETPDADATVLSTATGEITITDPDGGTYSVAIPETDLTEAGDRWYRVDAVQGTSRKTIVYGPLRVRDL
ncbi:hypothetical protein [Actinomadura sp. 21ATH]|uniref:hypothetical protein n=1 Tax=Actinomadura sp. 21ATH TaxID=1735444 RepID=UPI0035BF5A3A